jgi:von Willebrand factor A domain-containing protein 5
MEGQIIHSLHHSSGLYLHIPNQGTFRGRSYLPCTLTGVKAKAVIVDMVSRITLSQTFTNDNASKTYEALYRFPLHESSAVCNFELQVSNGRKIVGIVKAEEAAIKTYETAKSQGKIAALVLQKEPDIFQTKVGNIPAKSSITVTLTYITVLKQDTESNAVRYTLPTTIAPRYGNLSYTGFSNVKTSNMGFELTIDIKMPSQITSVSSPSHPIAMTLTGSTTANVTLSNTSPSLNKDIVVLVASNDLDTPRCVIETHPTSSSKCAMLTLIPRFHLPRAPTEVIFVIDRSGSMQGKVDTLRRSLQIFLKSLPASPEIYFNICSFGSRFEFLFKDGQSKKYDSKTLKDAEDYIANVMANFGGTEILHPLLECMKKRRVDCQTSIILLTDGQVHNTTSIVTAIAEEKAKHADKPLRVFSLGIGNSVSHHLVEGIARAGGGYSQLVMDQERLDKKVVRMLSAGLQTALNDLNVDWPGKPAPGELVYKLVKVDVAEDFQVLEIPEKQSTSFFDSRVDDMESMKVEAPPEPPKSKLTAPTVQQIPETIPNLYNTSRHVMFFHFPSTHPTPQNLTLSGTTPDGTVMSLDIPVTDSLALNDKSNPILHTLAAKTLLSELEEGRIIVQQMHGNDPTLPNAIKQEGIRIGVTYNLASKWTSFVAVDEHEKDMAASDEKSDSDSDSDSIVEFSGDFLSAYSVNPRRGSFDNGFFRLSASSQSGTMRERSAASPPPAPRSSFLSLSINSVMPYSTATPADGTRTTRRECSNVAGDRGGGGSRIKAKTADGRVSVALTDEQRLHEIIMHQSSSGAFSPNIALASHTGFSDFDAVSENLPLVLKEVVNKHEIWMTALVCVYLEKKMTKEKDVWELVVEKAWAFIATSVSFENVAALRKAAEASIA